MLRNKYRVVSFVAALIVLSSPALAHPANTTVEYDYYNGNRQYDYHYTNWALFEGRYGQSWNLHAADNNIVYKFDTSVSASYQYLRTAFNTGATLWRNRYFSDQNNQWYFNVNLESSGKPAWVTVKVKYDSSVGNGRAWVDLVNAQRQAGNSTHLKAVDVYFNSYRVSPNDGDRRLALDAAHEIGHVMGLADLYEGYPTILMGQGYWNNQTLTYPTVHDTQGAANILGIHGTNNSPHEFKGYAGDKRECHWCRGYQTLVR